MISFKIFQRCPVQEMDVDQHIRSAIKVYIMEKIKKQNLFICKYDINDNFHII